jgi:hypothetical protein
MSDIANAPTEAAARLAELFARRGELVAAVQDAERRMRFASDEVATTSAAVEQAERARLRGDGTEQAVRAAEKQLQKSRELAAVPWPERATGARQALRDHDAAITAHITEHYGELAQVHNEKAVAAAEAVDAALRSVLDAIREREALVAEAAGLWRWVGHPRSDLVPRSRCVQPDGNLAQEIEAVLMQDGERPPLMPTSHLPERAEVTIPELIEEW